MKIQEWFENWGISGLKINAGFLSLEWQPQPEEEQAAWELYIELVTRVATQPLSMEGGDEKAALESVHAIFGVTRDLLKAKGRKAEVFSKIAIIILNQKVRPFTEKWHPVCLKDGFSRESERIAFREDLAGIQEVLQKYASLLAGVAGVEDFQDLEQGPLKEL